MDFDIKVTPLKAKRLNQKGRRLTSFYVVASSCSNSVGPGCGGGFIEFLGDFDIGRDGARNRFSALLSAHLRSENFDDAPPTALLSRD